MLARSASASPSASAPVSASVPASASRRPVPEALRRALQRLESGGAARHPPLPVGIREIDAALPGGGLRRGCVHEVGGDEAATGFCAALLALAGAGGGTLLWLARGWDLYPPGLVRYGIAPGRLLVVSGLGRPADMAWAMEEALRSGAVRGVVAESGPVGVAASRRLMLAAEGSDVVGLALTAPSARGATGTSGGRGGRPREVDPPGAGGASVPTAASRWRVTAVPGAGAAKWRIELLRHRGGRPAETVASWDGNGWGSRAREGARVMSCTEQRRTPRAGRAGRDR